MDNLQVLICINSHIVFMYLSTPSHTHIIKNKDRQIYRIETLVLVKLIVHWFSLEILKSSYKIKSAFNPAEYTGICCIPQSGGLVHINTSRPRCPPHRAICIVGPLFAFLLVWQE